MTRTVELAAIAPPYRKQKKKIAMYRITRFAVLSIVVSCCAAAHAASETDWRAMARYEYGQDFKPLLEIDREVIAVMSEPSKHAAFAARLAGLLTDRQTTPAAKQFICQKLQTVGTPAQVPVLAGMLDDPKTAEMARTTLEQIPGDESLRVLRAGLTKYRGELLIGLINSAAARRDTAAVGSLGTLADDEDAVVAGAAVWALGRIGGREAVAMVAAKAAQSPKPLPPGLAVPYLRCAAWLLDDGQTAEAVAIYRRLASVDESLPTRQKALQGILRAAGDRRTEIIRDWLADDDPLKRHIAAAELNSVELDTAILDPERLRDMPVAGR
ncbi:MAG: hypothetical protein GX621_16530, partial [Pirellulaceae bacterium]|nr:hypothetical protein [Pirellulaceae bacterium]